MTRSRLLSFAAAALSAAVTCGCGPNESPDTFSIVFTLSDVPTSASNKPVPLSQLSFTVAYTGGAISGAGTAAACDTTTAYATDTVTASDNENGRLTLNIDASKKSLVVDTDIIVCDFVASDQPSAENFTISITSASDADGAIDDLTTVDVAVTSTDVPQSASLKAEAAAAAGSSE